jgi:oxygen-independent coproporphyrinogen-3 oxidase
MSYHRPEEEIQLEMFAEIEDQFKELNLQRYEISNFAIPGKESRHNLIYWQNEAFWGLGLSAHSYFPSVGTSVGTGTRFWNPSEIGAYRRQIEQSTPLGSGATYLPRDLLPNGQVEELQIHQSLTDYCHMRLRTSKGLNLTLLGVIFSQAAAGLVAHRLNSLVEKAWIDSIGDNYVLSAEGLLVSNQVFLELTFLAEDIEEEGDY